MMSAKKVKNSGSPPYPQLSKIFLTAPLPWTSLTGIRYPPPPWEMNIGISLENFSNEINILMYCYFFC